MGQIQEVLRNPTSFPSLIKSTLLRLDSFEASLEAVVNLNVFPSFTVGTNTIVVGPGMIDLDLGMRLW
jgi:hypothetical protein